jgi:aryl-alcohol dehydrogenase-like predicted oxidoreductase
VSSAGRWTCRARHASAARFGALTDLVRQGKVRYIGSSSYSGSEIVEAQWTARDRHLERFRTEHPPHSLLLRGIECDLLPTAQRHGMGILTYSPLAGGRLSETWTAESSPTSPARRRLAARYDMSLPGTKASSKPASLGRVADEAGVSLIEPAIAFVVNHPAVTASIIGPRTMEQLDSQPPGAGVALDAVLLDRIDEIVKPGVNINPADNATASRSSSPRCDGADPSPIAPRRDRGGRIRTGDLLLAGSSPAP